MKVYVLFFINNNYRDIGGIFESEFKLYEHLWNVLEKFPGTPFEVEEHEILR